VVHLPAPLDDLMRAVYLTGWRYSEIMTLRWEAIDRAEGSIRLSDSKTGPRVRPYAEDRELRAVIERRFAARALGCPFVFHRNGRAVRYFTKAWHAARVKAGLPGKLRHDCRRTAYRDLFAAGVDPFTAIDLVGHKSLATVQRYNIVDLSRARAGLAKLDAARHPDVYPTREGQRGRKGQS
jgi:integrase